MKRKTLTLTLSLLVCLSLIGVGFAAWVITSSTEKTLEGNIVIDSVEDKRLDVTYTWVTDEEGTTDLSSAPTLSYGIQEGVVDAPTWLSNVDTKENLSAYLKITVTDKDKTAYTTAKITSVLTAETSFTDAVTAGLVGTLPEVSVTNKGNGVYILSFTLTWGNKFNNQNPAECFAGKKIDDSLPTGLTDETYATCGDYVSHYLNALDSMFTTNPTYTLVVTVAREDA